MFKFNTETLIAHPIHTSAFVVTFGLLLFFPYRLPVMLGLLLLGCLVYLSMFFGAKFAVPDSANRS